MRACKTILALLIPNTARLPAIDCDVVKQRRHILIHTSWHSVSAGAQGGGVAACCLKAAKGCCCACPNVPAGHTSLLV
jgi:hypothetical protein